MTPRSASSFTLDLLILFSPCFLPNTKIWMLQWMRVDVSVSEVVLE